MTTLTLYEKALERIVQLQDLLIEEQQEVLGLMEKNIKQQAEINFLENSLKYAVLALRKASEK
jgi:hypothetical protein